MRLEDIRFKAKSIYNGEWVKGFYFRDSDTDNSYILIKSGECIEVDPSTVCQYTGEKDMNGKDIYIGDIISNLETGSVMETVWNDRLKRLDCKFLNGAKNGLVPLGLVVTKYKHIVVLMSKFDKEV